MDSSYYLAVEILSIGAEFLNTSFRSFSVALLR
jgi:hypothetical protein